MQIEEARRILTARLGERRGEIEQAVLTRTYAIADPTAADFAYRNGLRAAVGAALEYGIAALGRSEERPLPVPTALLSQARLAARNGIGLDTVLRRYVAGYTLLGDFLIEEAERAEVSADALALKRVLRAHAATLDRLLAAVGEEHGRELARPSSREERRAERIGRLLAGEPLDTTELAYDFEGRHLGLLYRGPGAREVSKALARTLDARLLAAQHEGEILWSWLGSRHRLDPEDVVARARAELPSGLLLAIGEPGEGLAGWRLTHRQAEAAMAVAQRGPEAVVRYAEVALLACALQDELLATSLRELYLEPLAGERDGGEVLRETLRAYLASGLGPSSAAAALGVSHRTVANRLRKIEERIGHPVATRVAGLEIALRLERLEREG
ncbi:MAG: PucR family transcriptional regulator [Chloroflexota bacterium]